MTAQPGARVIARAAGLNDALFEHDGQITKREIRAMTLSSLAPCRGELLWDIGAGAGSVAIEWMLCDPSLRAIAIEARFDRVARIHRNAAALGVPEGTVKSARTELDGISAAQDASEGPIRSLLLYRVDVSPATPPIGRANLTRLAVAGPGDPWSDRYGIPPGPATLYWGASAAVVRTISCTDREGAPVVLVTTALPASGADSRSTEHSCDWMQIS